MGTRGRLYPSRWYQQRSASRDSDAERSAPVTIRKGATTATVTAPSKVQNIRFSSPYHYYRMRRVLDLRKTMSVNVRQCTLSSLRMT